VVGVPALLVALLFLGEDRASLNYKLSYTVEVADKPFTGASVVSVTRSYLDSWLLPGGGGTGNIYKGEAVVVDLGEGRYLFSLLRSADSVDHAGYLATMPFEDSLWPQTPRGRDVSDFTVVDFVRLLKKQKPSTTLAPDHYPLLVTFKDINDPSSVVEVDPYDLDAAFGLCADGSGWRDEQAPWRAAGMKSLRWQAWQASGLSREEFDKQYSAGVPFGQRVMESITPRDTSNDCHRLQPITIAITSERRTKGKVEKVLGWLKNLNGRLKPTNKRFLDQLTNVEKLSKLAFVKE
jgi:hypothetical protein